MVAAGKVAKFECSITYPVMVAPTGAAVQERVTVSFDVTATLRVGAGGTRMTTLTTWEAEATPRALDAVSVTGKLPGVVKVWLGFWSVLRAVPSPKFQDQLVGVPLVVSVN
jgi:hypothetical protein